jgi:hypothetical protein
MHTACQMDAMGIDHRPPYAFFVLALARAFDPHPETFLVFLPTSLPPSVPSSYGGPGPFPSTSVFAS